MCGWGPYAREASVWEACCRYCDVINMFLNCPRCTVCAAQRHEPCQTSDSAEIGPCMRWVVFACHSPVMNDAPLVAAQQKNDAVNSVNEHILTHNTSAQPKTCFVAGSLPHRERSRLQE